VHRFILKDVATLAFLHHNFPFVSQETIKQLQEEVSCIEEAQCVFNTFSDWLSAAQNNFGTVAVSVDVVDRLAMDRKMKKLEVVSLDCFTNL